MYIVLISSRRDALCTKPGRYFGLRSSKPAQPQVPELKTHDQHDCKLLTTSSHHPGGVMALWPWWGSEIAAPSQRSALSRNFNCSALTLGFNPRCISRAQPSSCSAEAQSYFQVLYNMRKIDIGENSPGCRGLPTAPRSRDGAGSSATGKLSVT